MEDASKQAVARQILYSMESSMSILVKDVEKIENQLKNKRGKIDNLKDAMERVRRGLFFVLPDDSIIVPQWKDQIFRERDGAWIYFRASSELSTGFQLPVPTDILFDFQSLPNIERTAEGTCFTLLPPMGNSGNRDYTAPIWEYE